jgi:gliding motility-associated lipoprotein GldH
MTDNAWFIKDKKEYWLEIQQNEIAYKISLNLRITNDYRFSNLFILLKIQGPQKELQTKRLEFTLADNQGDWLGSGSGNIYTYRIPITKDLKFAHKGVYKFEIEQDMRDNPLRGLVDIGLRIEKNQ